MIGDYIIKNAHDKDIFKVIALPNNRIASCSSDRTIKIWKCIPYSDTPIKVLKGHNNYEYPVLYIKERDIMISVSNNSLRLWNMTTYQCVTVIQGIQCFPNGLCKLER